MSSSRLIAVILLVAALAACNGDTAEEGEVAGQVLEGTISDQMLPVDQVRSEAPLADPTGARRGSAGESEDAADIANPAEADAEPAEDAPGEPAEAEEE